MTNTGAPTTATTTQPVYPHRWGAAFIMLVAALMDLIDVSIVNVALPTIQKDLGASDTQLQWVISSYLLAFAITLITAGRLGDAVGRKRLFLIGVALFGVGSLASGLAQNPQQLIAARAVQGFAAAVMVPQVLATFRSVFSGKERGAAFGMYGGVAGVASALGLLLGGALVSSNLLDWHWRSVFLINIPIVILALAVAPLLVPETRRPSADRPDYTGMVLLGIGLLALTYPLVEGQRLGWPAWTYLLAAAGTLLTILVVVLGPRLSRPGVAPILPRALFEAPAFSAGVLVQLVASLGLQGLFLVLALWLQTGQGYSPIEAGATAAASSLGAIITAGLSISLARTLGRYVLMTGAATMAAGSYGLLLAAQHARHGVSPWQLVPGLLLFGAGLGLLLVPLSNVVLAAVPRELAGGASGTFNTAQQLGGAVGVALTGAIFFPRVATVGATNAFQASVLLPIGAFAVGAILTLALPRTAVTDTYT